MRLNEDASNGVHTNLNELFWVEEAIGDELRRIIMDTIREEEQSNQKGINSCSVLQKIYDSCEGENEKLLCTFIYANFYTTIVNKKEEFENNPLMMLLKAMLDK